MQGFLPAPVTHYVEHLTPFKWVRACYTLGMSLLNLIAYLLWRRDLYPRT
jgi:hypothetical protein